MSAITDLKKTRVAASAPAPTPTTQTDIIALPCEASALETALHRVCDSGTIFDWTGAVKYSGGKLVLEAAE